MLSVLDPLRELSFPSVVLRLGLALILGGLLGLERVRKRRPAGIRTYMLVCVGAALTMFLGQYQTQMLATHWAEAAKLAKSNQDITRFSAQVINGIGFLGAGTVLVTGKQQVKGLTTAAGLWASACMGIAIGAGFYECVLLAFLLIFLSNRVFPFIESLIVENAKNINLYIEFDSMDDVSQIISCIKSMNAQIYEVELDRGHQSQHRYPNMIVSMRLHKRKTHTGLILELSHLKCVRSIDEV